ncbi:hypothetical protein Tsubulata_021648 [Turnera subulata]|uniref:Pentacotripeptide-repeat region of PRORP domain-containing protein n=1 Tax=Turnera subulata TaxID=218843 RepID=A0A9Q0GCE9_9ROSI|nr:hypothetical protein Tsubulata_021648 [Turnera subulata]
MRHSWRFLLFRNYPRSCRQIPTHSSPHFQVQSSSSSLRSISSLSNTHFANPAKNPSFTRYPFAYNFSTEPLADKPTKETDHSSLVSDVFTKFSDVVNINNELELHGVVISHELVLKVLESLESNPDGARRFFEWVLERDSERLSSKGYNLMLGILGSNGLLDEFWALVETMKKKGYGISRGTRDKMSDKFAKEGLKSDLERLQGVFASGSVDKSVEKVGLVVSRIVKNQVWGEDVERKIKDLNLTFSSDLVKIVVENLAMEPIKAVIFFRWVEESGLTELDERSYNAMVRVLGREDCIERFWKVANEMRSKECEMEVETFSKVLGRFVKRKMMNEAVDLYAFAMDGANKPQAQCCVFLLRKIVASKEFDMDLFSRVVKIFTGSGNVLTDSMLNSVLKSLRGAGRFGDCNLVLKEMKEGGYVASDNLQSKVAFGLTSAGKKDEAAEFVDSMEASGNKLEHKAWVSMIKGYCRSGDLGKASECFQSMLGKEGISDPGYAFEYLVNAYCCKYRALDACKLLHGFVSENQLKPWHSTYRILIGQLLAQDGFKHALNMLELMKTHGYPPFVAPVIKYVSSSGTGDDAIAFMKAMTSKKFPSTSVVLRLFKSFFKAGRHDEAQDFLSKCPGSIRNHADVLNLFSSMKSDEDTAATPVAVQA